MTKRDQSRFDKVANNETDKAAKKLLDQHAKELSDRHLLRLEKMTAKATTHYLTNQSSKHFKRKNQRLKNKLSNIYHINFQQLTIPIALVSSTTFLFWLWWAAGQPSQIQNDPAIAKYLSQDSAIPDWVMDTRVPVSLLNNRAFYDWLARQEDLNEHG